MQPIPLEPGMRVRCVDARGIGEGLITTGAEYTIRAVFEGYIYLVGRPETQAWRCDRFKPVVRVTMGSVRSIGRSLVSVTTRVGLVRRPDFSSSCWTVLADHHG